MLYSKDTRFSSKQHKPEPKTRAAQDKDSIQCRGRGGGVNRGTKLEPAVFKSLQKMCSLAAKTLEREKKKKKTHTHKKKTTTYIHKYIGYTN